MGEDEVEEAKGNSTGADPSYLFHDGRSGQPKGGLGGGWTVVLKRAQAGNKEEYFYRAWDDYLLGFGHLNSEFWMGLDNIQAMADKEVLGGAESELLVELWPVEGEEGPVRAHYTTFALTDDGKFRLLLGKYEGDAGDALEHSK